MSSKPVFNYTGSFTTQNPTNSLTLMNREQFIQKSFDVDWETSYIEPELTEPRTDWSYLDIVLDPELRDDFDKRNSLFGNFYADIDALFLEGLNYRINFGNNYSWDRQYSSNEYDNAASGGAFKLNQTWHDWTLDHILTYKNTFADKHSVDLTLVAGQRERNYEATNAIGINYNNLRLSYNDLSLAAIQNIESSAWDESFLYQMARLNYEFNYNYLVTATVRRDGFSGFARNEKTALFPSVGLGWILSEESFLDKDWLDNLKLRGSYGSNGNPASMNFGCDVQPYHNLFPIPFSEIESNTGANLEQNPGYSASN